MKKTIFSFLIAFLGFMAFASAQVTYGSAASDANIGSTDPENGKASGSVTNTGFSAATIQFVIAINSTTTTEAELMQPSAPGFSFTSNGVNSWIGSGTIAAGTNINWVADIVGKVVSTGHQLIINGQDGLGGSATTTPKSFDVLPGQSSTITISPATQNGTVGTPITLTASGCTGGTYTWTPAGGTPGGTGNSTYTVNATAAGSVTYTATCSSGGSGTSTINWQTGTPSCAANAGTLN